MVARWKSSPAVIGAGKTRQKCNSEIERPGTSDDAEMLTLKHNILFSLVAYTLPILPQRQAKKHVNVDYRARKNGLQNVTNTTQAGLGRL